jgi:hypothetical protein
MAKATTTHPLLLEHDLCPKTGSPFGIMLSLQAARVPLGIIPIGDVISRECLCDHSASL